MAIFDENCQNFVLTGSRDAVDPPPFFDPPQGTPYRGGETPIFGVFGGGGRFGGGPGGGFPGGGGKRGGVWGGSGGGVSGGVRKPPPGPRKVENS